MTALSPQIGRLARLLDVDPSSLAHLCAIPDDELRTLHGAIGAAIFDGNDRHFARVAALSKTLPGPVAGKLAERFLPPTLAARVSERLDPAKARELVGRVSVGYLADISVALDPNRSEHVIRAIPAHHIGAVARELFDRGEHQAMAEFAGVVEIDALRAAFDVATAHDLLTVVPCLVWNDAVDRVIDDIPADRIDAIIAEIVRAGLWSEGSHLIEKLGDEARERLIQRVGDLDATLLAALKEAADDGRLGSAASALLTRATPTPTPSA